MTTFNFDQGDRKVAARQFGPTFRNRRVIVTPAMGPIREEATLVKPDKHMSGWWIVRWDTGGGGACVHGSMLQAVEV